MLMAMNLKKISAFMGIGAMAGAFLLLVLGKLNFTSFLTVAIAIGLFAYKILPKMK